MRDILTKKLRKESSTQYSGIVKTGRIFHLKERHYFPIDIQLDGDAPKQYIKAYFYYKNCPRISKPHSWDKFFAKFGGKSYPYESIIEYTINKIGEFLDLNMNESKIVIVNDQIRFLSKDFIKKGRKLIHGIEILQEYYEDKEFVEEINKDRKRRREYLTFDEIEKAIKHVYSLEANEILDELIKMITFDAICGNNDRHFYNWGVIGNIKSEDSGVIFAPIYDSSRGLLWNRTDENVLKMYNQSMTDDMVITSYTNRSKPRFSFKGNPDANHFELIKYLKSYKDRYCIIIENLINRDKEEVVLNKVDHELRHLFGFERFELIKKILKFRFKKLRLQ